MKNTYISMHPTSAVPASVMALEEAGAPEHDDGNRADDAKLLLLRRFTTVGISDDREDYDDWTGQEQRVTCGGAGVQKQYRDEAGAGDAS